MPWIQRSAVLPYTPSEMYALVNDLENYPHFLPWCRAATILSRSAEEVKATLHITKGGIHHSFTTVNRLQPNKQIELHLLEGPFRKLEGCWRFEPAGAGCRVSFDLEFVLAHGLLNLALGPLFQNIANTFVESFSRRAEVVYGQRTVV